jgi:hypothetical protein
MTPASTLQYEPQRGDLFIANDVPISFFLFFGGAAFAKRVRAGMSSPKGFSRMKWLLHRAAEEQKAGLV